MDGDEFGLMTNDYKRIAVEDAGKYFYGNSELVVDSNGNVGIGTDTPSAKLDVVAPAEEAAKFTAGSHGYI